MHCKISCSFGEIVDKFTILIIKKNKTNDSKKLYNINNELELLVKDNPNLNEDNYLFQQLHNVNLKLWILEDLIRLKSNKKEFDKEYIECSENIHITNDLRAEIKKKINLEFNSFLFEEKIYNNNSEQVKNDKSNDRVLLEIVKNNYNNGKYYEDNELLEKLYFKYDNENYFTDFHIEVIFCYSLFSKFFKKPISYFDKMKNIIDNISNINISNQLKDYCKLIFCMECLSKNNYKLAYPYLNYYNNISGPNINKNNMSFFQNNDIGKTLFIYDGGGFGDTIMLSRFIPMLCNLYPNNFITFLIHDKILWIYEKIFSKLKNLKFITLKNIENNEYFYYHYHCSLITIIKYCSIEFNDICFTPLFTDLSLPVNDTVLNIIKEIKEIKNKSKKTFIFNWNGNKLNSQEKYNRSMELKNAIPLFELDVNWIIITKDISLEEKEILDNYNITIYSDIIDNNNAFLDTMIILRNVDGIFSTDTGLVHLAANLNIPTYVMLTLGCDWRWSNNNWYPDINIIKQKKQGDWSHVIEEIKLIVK